MANREKALVLDGRTNSALAATRSLGKSGISVTCCESFRENPTFFSRYTRRKLLLADPDREPERFLDDLEAELSSGAYQSVLTMRGVTTGLLVEHRQRFEPYVRFCLPGPEAFSICNDKGKTAEAARKHGMLIPTTYLPENQSLESIASGLEYPALIKPRVSSGSRGIVYVRDAGELFDMYPVVKAAYGEPIIQEYIGDDRKELAAAFLFNDSSELRAAVVWEKVHMYPVRGGPTALGVTIDRSDIVELGAQFLQKLGWRGVASMGLVVDPLDSQVKLIEVNPRFWMTLSHAIHAGVDFPYLLHRIVVDGDVEPAPGPRIGAYYRWLLPADILWSLNVEKSRHHVREFLRFRRPDQCYAICSASDPLPMVGAGLQAFRFARNRTTRDFILKRGW